MLDQRRPRFVALLASVMAVLGALVLAPTTANAAGPGSGGWWSRDSVTVGGYDDYQIDRTVDVVNRTTGNNLVFWYTAGRALDAGSVTIDLPADAWPTPLQLVAGLSPSTQVGGVGVRPDPPAFPGAGDPAQYCSRGGAVDPQTGRRNDVTVVNTASVHRISVNLLDCAPGQKIAIRIVGLTAPKTGVYRFPVQVSGIGEQPRSVADPWLVVRPTPRVHLSIQLPPTPIDAGQGSVPAPITVRVVNDAGRPVTTFSGTIRLYTDPPDCAVAGKGYQDYDVTPSRDGRYRLAYPFRQQGTYALIAEDVDHRVVSARSGPFTVVDGVTAPVCPASYH